MAVLCVVAAVASNGVIGRGGELPWQLPADLRHFRALTLGKPVVMGRRTFVSIGRALPGRTNIVISRDPGFKAEGAQVVSSLEDALARAGALADRDGVGEVMVIGGAEIYAAALPRAQRLYLTRVHAAIEGDVFFPVVDWVAWRETAREDRAAGPGEVANYSFLVYERR